MSQQINLYNPALRVQKEYLNSKVLILSLILGVIGIALAAAYYSWQIKKLGPEVAAVEAELRSKQDEFAQLAEIVGRAKQSKQVAMELERMEGRLREREQVKQDLGSGIMGSPEGFYAFMRAFAKQTVSGVWLTGLSITSGGKEMTLQGRTLNPDMLPGYLLRLNQEPAMKGRTFAALDVQLEREESREAAAKPAATYGNAASLGSVSDAGSVSKAGGIVEAKPKAARFHEFVLSASKRSENLADANQSTASATPSPVQGIPAQPVNTGGGVKSSAKTGGTEGRLP